MAAVTPGVYHASAGKGRTGERRPWREWLTFLAFVLPNLGLFALFSYWPLLQNVYLSFVEWDMIAPEKLWVGLDNWTFLLTDRDFWLIVRNTFVFTAGSVGLTLLLGLGVALLLNQPLRGRNAARSILFTPTILSYAAIAVIWVFIFDPNWGLLRYPLTLLGLPSPRWLTDVGWALPAVMIVYVWKNLGYSVVIFLAGLQGIPRELYEAARVDGAGPWDRFKAVTLPGLAPISFFLLVTSLLASFQAFDIIRVMTQGGPVIATTTLVYALYQEAFVGFHAGTAAVYAVVLFLLMLALTIIQLRFLERRITYS